MDLTPNIDNGIGVNKHFGVDYSFFYDYENGLDRFVFKVYVSGVVDFEENFSLLKRGDKSDPYLSIESREDLYAALMSWIDLWVKPYVVVEKHPTYFIVKDRGIRFRAWVYRRRFYDLINHIPKSWFRVKGKRSKHVVITITLPHENLGIGEAYKLIKKRVRSVISYFNKRYGVKAYLGVWEVHESGYPHVHLILFLKKSIPVFKHKGIWRFSHKRVWDVDLKVSERGFIDCFAVRGGKEGVRRYFSKYLSKVFSFDLDGGDNSLTTAQPDCITSNAIGKSNLEMNNSHLQPPIPTALLVMRSGKAIWE